MELKQSLQYLLDRLSHSNDGFALLGTDETVAWPAELVPALVQSGVLSMATPSTELVCPGCEEGCVKDVFVSPAVVSRPSRAFIARDERDDVGRVTVNPNLLNRWQFSVVSLAQVVARLLGCVGSLQQEKDGAWNLGCISSNVVEE